jgi:hypothetical protein
MFPPYPMPPGKSSAAGACRAVTTLTEFFLCRPSGPAAQIPQRPFPLPGGEAAVQGSNPKTTAFPAFGDYPPVAVGWSRPPRANESTAGAKFDRPGLMWKNGNKKWACKTRKRSDAELPRVKLTLGDRGGMRS